MFSAILKLRPNESFIDWIDENIQQIQFLIWIIQMFCFHSQKVARIMGITIDCERKLLDLCDNRLSK